MSVTLIEHNADNYRIADRPDIPWVLECTLRAPEFMQVAFIFMHGNEYVKVRGGSEQELQEWAQYNRLPNHPRLISLKIYKP